MRKVIFYAPDDNLIIDDRNNTDDHVKAICQMTENEILKLCRQNEKGIDVEVMIED